MRETGIARRLDKLGRITLPVELRRSLALEQDDPVEIFMEGKSIILQKREKDCVLCGEERAVVEFKGKLLCQNCVKDIQML